MRTKRCWCGPPWAVAGQLPWTCGRPVRPRDDQATAAAGGLDTARARLDEITVRRDAACAAAGLAPQVEAAHAAMLAAVDAHQALVDAHQAGVNALLGGMAAELAAQLTAGEPCPVCGSPEHPAPAHPQPDAVSASDVAGLAEQRDEAERGRARREEDKLKSN